MTSTFFHADFMHEKGPEPTWQESVVMFFHDLETDLSGYFRLGIEPNVPACQEWIYLQDGDGRRFRRLRFGLDHDQNSRRMDGFRAGGLDWRYEGDCIHLIGTYEDVSVDIYYRDFYPSTPCWKWIGGDDVDIGAAAHYESSGSVTGTVRLGDRTIRLGRAMGHRDHSWGTRDGDNLRACRWFVGTTGPELSHSSLSFLDQHGNLAVGGWVVRNGVVTHAKHIDNVVQCNMDGLTIRSGRIVMLLEDDSTVEIDVDVRSSFITGHNSDHGGPHSYVASEGVSRTLVNGKQGICDLTVVNNVTGVGAPVSFVLEKYSTLKDGLSQRPRG